MASRIVFTEGKTGEPLFFASFFAALTVKPLSCSQEGAAFGGGSVDL
jgi:hypothetical protein